MNEQWKRESSLLGRNTLLYKYQERAKGGKVIEKARGNPYKLMNDKAACSAVKDWEVNSKKERIQCQSTVKVAAAAAAVKPLTIGACLKSSQKRMTRS